MASDKVGKLVRKGLGLRLKPMKDTDTIPFGLHKGKQLKDVPDTYLLHIGSQDWITKWPQLHAYILKNEDVIKFNIKNGTK